jgi:hypothetical protein
MQIDGRQFEQFSKILRDAFTLQRFDEMLRFRLDINREDIALGDDYQEVVFKVIRASEMQGWFPKMLIAARASRPSNAHLVAFAQMFDLAPIDTPDRGSLEKIISKSNSMLDITAWRQQLGQIEGRVCRVEVDGQAEGTGFLVAPDIVITNYHVVESVITGKGQGSSIRLRFDYKRLADGTTVNNGTLFDLQSDAWLIDHSPYDPVDEQASPKPREAATDKLDYAFLRVRDRPGDSPIGGQADQDAPKRGWIEIQSMSHDFLNQPALFIVQHPKGDPLKLALDTQAVVEVNDNGARIRYRTNTEPGSSGSPVFDQNWNLVALHHSGEPAFKPSWNEGIPFTAILALLKQRGIDVKLDGAVTDNLLADL